MILFTPTDQESDSLGKDCIVTGMGKLAMIHTLYKYLDELIEDQTAILVGFCGLLKGNYKIGNLIPQPSIYIDGDYNSYPLEEQTVHFIEVKRNPTIACISQDRLLTNNPYKDICKSFKTVITDMESYTFVEFCRMHRIKYKVLRVVSDIVGTDSVEAFKKACANGILGKAVEKELV